MLERVHKIISRFTNYSLRKAEGLILEGRIKINNSTVIKLGTLVDIKRDSIYIDGNKIIYDLKDNFLYYCFYKPRFVICSKVDDFNRTTIYNILNLNSKYINELSIVGRLDFNTEGIILLTNNKSIVNYLLHPKNKINRIYHVKIKGSINDKFLKDINFFLKNNNSSSIIETISIIKKKNNNNTWIKINLVSGKSNFIKRLFWKFGFLVLKIIRYSFAGVSIKNMLPGSINKIKLSDIKI